MNRAGILSAALELFADKGYDSVEMVDIAEAAHCSLDECYRWFPNKAEIILYFYHRLAVLLEERLPDLQEGSLSERFSRVMDWKIELLIPYRPLLCRLMAEMSDDSKDIGVFSPVTEAIRTRVTGVFANMVYGAPTTSQAPSEVIRLVYRLHLGLVWSWVQDPRMYKGLLKASKALLSVSVPLLPYQPVQKVLEFADRFTGQLAAPNDLQWDALAEKILRRIFFRRRSLNPASGCHKQACSQCLAPHLAKVQAFLEQNEAIHLVIPAFPAKSPNPQKTLGKLPDLGEILALRNLQTLCDEIQDLYEPGAKVTICSDGHVFSDLVLVSDETVSRYHEQMAELLRQNTIDSVELFCLADLHGDISDYDYLREQLMVDYGEPVENLKRRCQEFPHHRAMLDGIHRFLFEDRVVICSELSRSKNRKQTRPLAYQVVARSNAWSRVVAEQFPRALRLSIHPQPDHSEKIGFLLTKALDNWITPWHGSILLKDDEFLLMKRSQAEGEGGVLVEADGRPSHFVLRK